MGFPRQGLDSVTERREQKDLREDASASANGTVFGNGSLGIGVVLMLCAIALIITLWVVAGIAGVQAREQGAYTLRQSILECAMQCFAVEGAYPPTLDYLQENYGLAINEEDYLVRYEAFASNILPSVVVMLR